MSEQDKTLTQIAYDAYWAGETQTNRARNLEFHEICPENKEGWARVVATIAASVRAETISQCGEKLLEKAQEQHILWKVSDGTGAQEYSYAEEVLKATARELQSDLSGNSQKPEITG